MDNTHKLIEAIEEMGYEVEEIKSYFLNGEVISLSKYQYYLDGKDIEWLALNLGIKTNYKVTKKKDFAESLKRPWSSDIADRFTDYSGGTLHYIHNDDLSLAICTEYKGKE